MHEGLCGRCGRVFLRLRKRGSFTQCSPCSQAVRVKAWMAAHPNYEKRTQPSPESKKRYATSALGMQRSREKALRFYHKHKHDPVMRERFRSSCRNNYARNPDAYIQNATNRKKHVKRATPQWADRQAIADVYKQARHLSLETGITHEVDHFYPLRGRKVSGLHVEWNLRIISAADNRTKRNYMPEAMAL